MCSYLRELHEFNHDMETFNSGSYILVKAPVRVPKSQLDCMQEHAIL